MEITQSYPFPSSARPRGDGLDFSLPTESARPGVRLEALVLRSRSYGRVMGALHRVVSQQARFQEADHSAYQSWVRGEYLKDLAPYLSALQGRLPQLQSEREELGSQLAQLDGRAGELWAQVQRLSNGDAKSFREAQRKFWQFLYTHDFALWVVLDPVVSVDTDAVLLEVF